MKPSNTQELLLFVEYLTRNKMKTLLLIKKKENMRNIVSTFVFLATIILPISVVAQSPVNYFGAIPDLKVSGKEFVDPTDKAVTLHGVMDTPNDYFNGGRWRNGSQWPLSYDDPNAVTYCKQYFTKIFQAIANPSKGTYCNLFRLHLDPAWTNDPNKTAANGGGENDISRFSADRLRKFMTELYVPIVKDALAHGLYVIMRPPGVFPEDVKVGDAYNQYLLTVWDIVSSNDYVKSHAGQIMLELGNEPVRMSGNLADYFQPIVNKIRQNGFTGILLLPGTSYQADYRNYNTKAISDNNYGYAVHNYPGWYGGWDANQSEADFISTFEAQVPVDKKPIVITEVDWSPMKEGAGHWNEGHTQYTEGNFGTWATGTTTYTPPTNISYPNTQNTGWGTRFKKLVDKHPNISWTLQGTTTFVDMDAYLRDGTVKPAFTDAMIAAGYADASEACSKTCMEWYRAYACGDRIPFGTPSVAPEVEPHSTTAQTIGNAKFDDTNGHYCFYTSTYSSFVFNDFNGTELKKCADFTINLGEGSTIGYRLDVQLKDKDGNIIKDGDQLYMIGTEAKGTRFTSAQNKTYDFQTIFAEYIENSPGCTVGEIRLNTVVNTEDTNHEGLYWFTIEKMEMNVSEVTARIGTKGTSLADIKMYDSETGKEITGNNIRLNTEVANGEEVFGAGLLGNVSYKEYTDLTGYSKMIIKGNGGTLRVLFNRPDTGTVPELNVSISSGSAEVDLTSYPYFHLNSIKSGWGQTVNVSSIMIMKGDGSDEEIADYYITGAGHITDEAQAALNDLNATVIDATGLTNVNPWSIQTANPNCLIIYSSDAQVGFTWNETTRNLVKNSGGFSSYRTNLYDGYDFRAPFAFNTVGGASYTRTLTTEWATIAIPFNLDIISTEAEIYVLTSISSSGDLVFTKQKDGTVPAGSVIMYHKQGRGDVVLNGKDISTTADGLNITPIVGMDGWYTAQSYTNQIIDDVKTDKVLKDYRVFGITGDVFVEATKKLTLKPFRAFYLYKGDSPAKSTLTFSVDDKADGIDTNSTSSNTVIAIYDASGVKHNSIHNGLNIIKMSDGSVKKVYKQLPR